MLFRVGLIAAGFAVSLAVLVAVVIGFFSSEAPATGHSVSVEPRSLAKVLAQESRFDPGEKLEIEDEPLPKEQPRREEPAESRKEAFRPKKSQSSFFRTTLPAPEEAASRPKDEERDLLVEEPRYFDPKPGAVMSLTISSLGLYEVPVTSSDSQQALDNGVIHLPETSLPWDRGGQRNVYVVGHRLGYEGTASRLIFYKLNELGTGDEIILEGRGRIYRYQVSESFEVSPHDVWVTDQVRGRDLLTLQTCTPLSTFENRLIVRADRVPGPSTKGHTLTKEQPKRPASSKKHRSLVAERRDSNLIQEEEKDDRKEEKRGLTVQRSEGEKEIRTSPTFEGSSGTAFARESYTFESPTQIAEFHDKVEPDPAAGSAAMIQGVYPAPSDATPPNPPTGLALDTNSDSGVSNDNITNDNTPKINGTAEADSKVKVYDGTTFLGETQAGSDNAGSDNAGSDNWSFTVPNDKALSDENQSIQATATDAANNTSEASPSLEVTVDTRAPDVRTVSPIDRATQVPLDTNVTATFSEEKIDTDSLTSGTVKLEKVGVGKKGTATYTIVPATLRNELVSDPADSSKKLLKVTLDPNSNLDSGAAYRASVTTGVKDEAGNPLAQAKVWNFKAGGK